MVSEFFKIAKEMTAEEMSIIGDCSIVGDKHKKVSNVAVLRNAQSNELSFCGNTRYLDDLKSTKAGVVIISEKYSDYLPEGVTALISKNVMASYGKIVAQMFASNEDESYISPTAIIHESAKIGKNVSVGDYVVIDAHASVGDGSCIDSFTKIGRNVQIGAGCRISSNVSIEYAHIGDNVSIHAGAKIGQAGFGIVPDGDRMVFIKQLGRVIIGNRVRIGANTTIDRGAIEDTVIGDDTIIDNLVQIAHNVTVGKMVTLVSQVGIAGSSIIDDGAVLAGQVGIAGHIRIGKRAIIAAKAGVASSVDDGAVIGGIPAVDIMTWKRQAAFLKKSVSRKDENYGK